MYNPRAAYERRPRRTEIYANGGRTIRIARIAERAMKTNVQSETSSWITPKDSVKTPTAIAPTPASATTTETNRSLNARRRNQAVARTTRPTRIIDGSKISAEVPTTKSPLELADRPRPRDSVAPS